MGWPLSQDYNEAVQSPRTSFGDPDLKGGEVVPGPMGLPLPRSGNFADVYQLRDADGRTWAVKCFTRPVAGLRERYSRIDTHLREARLPFAVGFRFLPEGIRIRGQWYPVLKMEWVEGFTLNEFVRQQANRADQLRALLGMWVRLCKRLRDARIAHADLQHGNVLLVPGETANKLKLRLIDYDGMWVPALAGKPSGEAGHPAYQHPARQRDRIYSADADRYPHLVIGCALRALAVAGKPLWDRFDNGDNLLFREADFADPSKSKVFRALWEMDDPTVTNLVALLAVSAGRPIRDTPWLDEVLSGEKAAPVSDAVLARAADLIGVERRASRRAAPVSQLYVVPEEANAFADLWSDADDAPRPTRRRKLSLLPIAASGCVAALAAGVVIALVLTRGGKETSPPDPGPNSPAAAGPGEPVPARRGVFKTEWAVLPARAPAAGPKALADGVDTGKPGDLRQPYGARGSAALGAWILPDGARAVLAGARGFTVVDLQSGKIEPAVQDVAAVRSAVTPDGRYGVIVDRDHVVRCFDMSTGLEQFSRDFPADGPALRISPDGKRFAVAAEGVGYAEWSIPDGKEVRRHQEFQAAIFAFSPDGTRAVAADREGTVELWDLDEGTITLHADVRASAVCVSPDGKQALAAGDDQKVHVWGLKDSRPQPALHVPVKGKVTVLAAAGDGTVFAGTEGGEVGYIPANGPGGLALNTQPGDRITGLALTEDSKYALVATAKLPAFLIRTRPRAESKSDVPTSVAFLDRLRSTVVPPDVRHLAVSVDAKSVLFATRDRVQCFDLDTLRQDKDRSFRLEDGEIMAAGFGPDDLLVVTERVNNENRTRTRNVGTGEYGPIFSVPGRGNPLIYRIVPVPKTPFVIARSTSGGDIVYDAKTGKPPDGWPVARVGDGVVAVPTVDGRLVAFGSRAKPVQLWDTGTGKVGQTFEASSGFYHLAFAPDGTRLIGCGLWGQVRVWDVETGKVIRDVDHDHSGQMQEFIPLGSDLAVFGPSPEWAVMDLNTGKIAGTDPVPSPLVGRVAAAAGQGLLVVADLSGRLTTWNVNRDRLADAPKRTARPGQWPDARLVRDAPRVAVEGLAHTPKGEAFVAATADGKLTAYSADRLLFQKELDIDDGVRAMARAGPRLFVLGRRSVVVYDAEKLDKVAEFPVSVGASAAPVFAVRPDGSEFLLATDKVRLTEVKSKRELVVNPPRAAGGKPLTQFVYAADGKSGVARWGNAVLTVWHPRQTTNAKVLEELKSPDPATTAGLALTPDGKSAILGTRAGEVRVWNTATGKILHSETAYAATGRPPVVESVAVLPGGKHFLTAGQDGRVILWGLDTFTKLREFKLQGGTSRLSVAPDGNTAVLQTNGQMVLLDLAQ